MKKSLNILTIVLAVAAMVAAFSCPALAAVTGPCANCHTMHNSQGGTDIAVNELNAKQADAYAHLTLSSCVGCHFEAVTGVSSAPKIDAKTAATLTAGGTFNTDANYANTMAKRHDVDEIWPGGDTVITNTPGNADSHQIVAQGELTCAGSKGCHGTSSVDNSDAAIKGFHHGSKDGYRYLQNASDHDPILGLKSVNWEKGGATTVNHNVYSADTSDGISALCANCHGKFHSTTNTGTGADATPWIRHPTDNIIPTDWAPYGTENVTVDPENNPFAFAEADTVTMSPTTMTGYTVANNARVACISCHRAHGSAHDDILRWAYADQCAGGPTTVGCLGCHTKQR